MRALRRGCARTTDLNPSKEEPHMDKRLTRTDLAFSLGFLFMLVVAVAAFFYGVKVGADRTEARYAADRQTTAAAAPARAYQQQDLVSFYHTVFLPYREFQTRWLETQQNWLADPSADRASELKQLARLADSQYEAAKVAYVNPLSPLLKQAQDSYLKSLKLFAQSFRGAVNGANEGAPSSVLSKLKADAYYKEGLKQMLVGQQAYFASMLKWGASVNPDIPDHYQSPAVLSTEKWQNLSLLVKNQVAADFLMQHQLMTDYLPQDLTAQIDHFIRSGQADKMKTKTIGAIGELLAGTDAVRSGDFLALKTQQYGKELLPQLPFFFPNQ
jgi:hypothetical protein